jgi:glycosyltransferase involved in cell wall biosynthesis
MSPKRDAVNRLPRVLYAVVLDPTQKFGSLEEQIAYVARAFQSEGSLFCPLFICPEKKAEDTAFRAAGIETEILDLRTFRWSRLMQLSRLITRRRITVMHWNFTEPLRNSYVWWLSFLHPTVRHFYTDHISRASGTLQLSGGAKGALKRLLWRRYDGVFCVSQFVMNHLRCQHIHSNLILARHFINTDRFSPNQNVRSELRTEFHVENRFVLLAVAQLIEEKGIDVLIRALTKLPDSVVLWIVGDGAELASLQQLCSELRLASRIQFHGLQRNVAPFMQAADCFVCPSLWAEAVGLVNLEATSCGLPIIASRIGGLPEYVLDGVTGLLFSPGDHAELARCVQRVFRDSTLYRKMSAAARDRAVDKFSAGVLVREYINQLREYAR